MSNSIVVFGGVQDQGLAQRHLSNGNKGGGSAALSIFSQRFIRTAIDPQLHTENLKFQDRNVMFLFCFVFKILSMFTLKLSCLFFVTVKLKHISYTFNFVSNKRLSRITHILNHPSCKLKMLLLSCEITWHTPFCKSRLGGELVNSTG